MSIAIERRHEVEELRPSDAQVSELGGFLEAELEDALASRQPQESMWVESLRVYEAPGDNNVRHIPIRGYEYMEVPLAAIATEALYAQVIDLIFSISPVLMARDATGEFEKEAKLVQKVIDRGMKQWGLRPAAEDGLLDTTQLGTGVYYVTWQEVVKRTLSATKVTRFGPRILSVPPEDFLVPGGAHGDLECMPWVAMRTWPTMKDLNTRAIAEGLELEGVQPAGNVGWVRSRRELLGRTRTDVKSQMDLFEVYDIYTHFDLDGDGLEEDLLVVYDKTSRNILGVGYNPFDRRPFAAGRYQSRAHLFYGMGVPEMLRQMQKEMTAVHNHRTLNMMLANTRMWASPMGLLPDTLAIWPGRNLQVTDPDKIKELRLSEVYPSSAHTEATILSLAERRVGTNELTIPRPSQVLGSRTPGITAMSLLQQANKRFAPAFDSMRDALTQAAKFCLYRIQERLLAGDPRAQETLKRAVGEEDLQQLVDAMRREDFDEAVQVELSASTSQANRLTDRQDAVTLMNVLVGYYDRVMQLAMVSTNPQVPEKVREIAGRIASATGEAIDRTIRTFDQVRDISRFIIDIDEAGAKAADGQTDALGQLAQIIQAQQQGGFPAAEGVPLA